MHNKDDVRKLLSPCIIKEESDSHLAVDDLRFALNQDETRNIAVTGSYGSGKSSVVDTCLREMGVENKVLRISMSTFELEKEKTPEGYDGKDNIEYKIVQHLLYKSDRNKTPYSWFHTIKHIEPKVITNYSLYIIIAILCYIIAFEPEDLQISSFYYYYNLLFGEKWGGFINLIADVLSAGYLLWFIYQIVVRALRRLFRLRNIQLDIKGFKMEASDTLSVFNKHLDEIVYTIRENEYDYILFEDLDRLKDSKQLFLKIRELNMLINESDPFKKTNRVVRFIYSIKDDLFTRELRTKCFDYIVAVVPVVDHYNVLDYIITEYKSKGLLNHIKDNELEQITNRLT